MPFFHFGRWISNNSLDFRYRHTFCVGRRQLIFILQTTLVRYIFFVENVGISIQIDVICCELHNPEENILILGWYLFLV